MIVITVEIVSDIVCLWCFIGKRTLEKAIALYQKTYSGGRHDAFVIKWRPYYLNYNRFVTSTQSIDKSEVAKVKFQGVSKEKMDAMSSRVHQLARANGIDFKFGGKIGSTRDAHRLIHLAQTTASPGIQDKLVEKLFQAYHEQEMDISEQSVLLDIAEDAGLSRSVVCEWLNSDQSRKEVDEDAERNRPSAPTGVPTFYIQGIYQVNGAQDLQEFYESFVKVREADTEAATG